ncbi:hypothetical protein IFR05_001849 [Cadophora sp. M221]|nr:hypothetical protein IFR05_001849 [Cadophora sp. M221]
MATHAHSGSMAIFYSSSFPDLRLSQAPHHPQEDTSVTILDESGSLIIRIYTLTPNTSDAGTARSLRADCAWIGGVVVAQFQVSTRAEMLNATRAEAEQVLIILLALQAPNFKFKYWFFHWLASKDVRQLNADNGPSVLILCEQFNHTIGAHIVQMKLTSKHLPASVAHYPPILTPSLRQHSEIIFLKRNVKPSEYVSGGFSRTFQYKYGKPMEYWSDFYALMTTKDTSQLTPQTKNKNFAYCVDDKVTKLNLATMWREDMEVAWAQKALCLYKDEVLRLGDTFTSNPYVREGLQCQLKKASAEYGIIADVDTQRFHPMLRVEKYWAKKGEGIDGKLWMKRVAFSGGSR